MRDSVSDGASLPLAGFSSRDIRPVPPIAPYQGGKRNLAGELVAAIDSIDHDCYAEPFGQYAVVLPFRWLGGVIWKILV